MSLNDFRNLPDDTPLSLTKLAFVLPTPLYPTLLKEQGIFTVGDLRRASDDVLLNIPSVGKGSVLKLRSLFGYPKPVPVSPEERMAVALEKIAGLLEKLVKH